ncbi:hypothetical protein LOZ58_002350 [Ophidiomyces ophidiicola]|nr:hypothetical protein LOZ58_002350 [Ophidiomyces ophidiicola]
MSSVPPVDDSHDQRQQEGSPSPPPPAPVPLAPGPRASRLQQVFSEALLRTIRANSYANFSSCFPTPAKHVPHSLESVWRQLNAKLEQSARAEFDDVIREREVVKGLNELDLLVSQAKRKKELGEQESGVAPHTLGATELYQAHLTPYLAQAQQSLDLKLEETEKHNILLAEKIQRQKEEIRQLLEGMEAIIGDIEGAAKAMQDFDPDNSLRQETERMDEEMNSVQRS